MTPDDLSPAIRFALLSIFAALSVDPRWNMNDVMAEQEAAAAMLTALDPRDAVQVAFAARAVVAHHAAMACFRRSALPDVADTMMTRLIASGMALSRQSTQMIKAIEQRKAMVRPATTETQLASVLAAEAAATAAPTSGGAQEPMPREKPPASEAAPAGGGQKPVHQAGGAARSVPPGGASHRGPGGASHRGPGVTRDERAAMTSLAASMYPAA